MKNKFLLSLMLSTTLLNAQTILRIYTKEEPIKKIEITEEAIQNTILNKKIKISKEKEKELIQTILKASAIYLTRENELKDKIFKKVNNKNITYETYYKYQISKLKEDKKDKKEFLISKIILFYTLWTTEEVQENLKKIKVTKEEIKELYKNLEKMKSKEEIIRLIYAKSKKKEKIEKLIKRLLRDKAEIKTELVSVELAEIKDKDIEVSFKYEEGIEKKNLTPEISNIKIKEFNKKPIKQMDGYYFVYIEDKIIPKLRPLNEIEKELENEIKQDKINKIINEKIQKSLKEVTIKY
jgi:hypothetical protein